MCIVIDTNVWSKIFPKPNKSNKEHFHYRIVYEWINDENKETKIVFGGSKYNSELFEGSKIRMQLKLRLKNSNKLFELNKELVDAKELELQSTVTTMENDHHLLAIFILSGCQVFCSEDKNAINHIEDKRFYPESDTIPINYNKHSSEALKTIFLEENIAKICQPCK